MVVKAFKQNGKWFAEIWNDDVCIQRAGPEPRVGCAIRQVMNRFEMTNGKPSFDSLIFDIGEW